MDLRVGTLIAGRFEVERRVGAGGMGTVYRARDRQSGAAVAVKALHGSASQRRFAREAWTLADLEHPGVVRYLDHGSEGDLSYLVMEWLDGEDLGARLARGALSLDEAIALMARITEAVSAAHARGIVHRDIKPQNIFLVGGDLQQVKLLDFGLARLHENASTLTVQGAIMGTPGYMAPEQARGEAAIGPAADVFALGCVLFECLAGRRPFQAEHRWAQLAKILFEDAPRLRSVRRDVPLVVDALVARMLAKLPADRPAHAGEVHRLLPRGGLTTSPTAAADAITSDELRLVSVVVADTDPALDGTPPPAGATTELGRSSSSGAGPTASSDSLTRVGAAGDLLAALRAMAAQFGGLVERLPSGRIIATFVGSGVAVDLAALAARWALAVRSGLPRARMVLTTGRTSASGSWPVGEAIDRAAALLSTPPDTAVDSTIVVDPATAGLLDVRFEIGGSAAGLSLLSERPQTATQRTLLGKPSRFVGRERELATVEAILAEGIEEPAARAVLITGEPGIGKSRLWHELQARVAARGDIADVWTSRGDPISAGSSFGVMSQLVRRAADLRDNDPVDVRQRRLAELTLRHVGADDRERITLFLGELVGAQFSDADHVLLAAARQDPFRMGDQIRRTFEDLVAARAASGPLALVIEDLHWGDLPSMRAIDSALRLCRQRPLLVIALGRPEIHDLFPRLWSERGVQEIRLIGLSRRSAEQMVRAALGARLAVDRIEQLIEQASGNAFHLEELIRSAAEDRLAAPETVLAMVQARLDTLEPTARRVLRAASIFGQVCWPAGLEAVMGAAAAAEIARWLPILGDRELLVTRTTTRLAGQPEYVFRHALVRDAVYATLTDADRALGHRLAARWLAVSTDVDPLTLAEHLEQAGEHEGAAAAFERAAAQALEGNDFAAVIARSQRGVAAGASGAALGRLRLLEAQALIWRGEVSTAETAIAEALADLPEGNADRYRAIGRRGWLLAQRGAAGAIAPLFDELARPADSPPAERARQIALAQVTAEIGMSAPLPEVNARIDQLERASAAAGDVDVAVRPWLALARSIAATRQGDRDRAAIAMRAVADGFESIGDHRLACLNRINAGFYATEIGAHAEAETMLRASLAAAQRMALTHAVALAQSNLALALFRSGGLDEARTLCESAVAQFRELGNAALESNALIYLADIQREADELALAEASARHAVQLLADVPAQRPQAQAMLARILVRRGAGDEALEVARAAMATRAEVGGLKEGDILAVLAYAESLHVTGRAAEARDAIREARQRLDHEVALLGEAAQRESCLREVPEHRRVVELAEAWLRDEA